MSMDLYWEPVAEQPDRNFPRSLKYVISQRYFQHDGSLGSDPVILNSSDLPYFEGLRDGNVEGANAVIRAIQKYGQIKIWTR